MERLIVSEPGLSAHYRIDVTRDGMKDSLTVTCEALAHEVAAICLAEGLPAPQATQLEALSRAYVSNPRVVLVDEVSLGLAPVVVDQLFEFLSTLLARGAALLIVEQYVSRALRLAAEVYVMSRGRVVLQAASSDEGMASAAISVARAERKKSSITSAESAAPTAMASRTAPVAAAISVACS